MIKFQRVEEGEEISNSKPITIHYGTRSVGFRIRLPWTVVDHIYSPHTRATYYGRHKLDWYVCLWTKHFNLASEVGIRVSKNPLCR